MKYIITENRISQVIYDFIDKLFAAEDGNTEIYTVPSLDTDKGAELVGAYDFVNNDYYGESGSEYLFSWTGEEYYKSLLRKYITTDEYEKLKTRAPILKIMDESAVDSLNGYFGDVWKSVFKKWFRDRTGLDYKTLANENNN